MLMHALAAVLMHTRAYSMHAHAYSVLMRAAQHTVAVTREDRALLKCNTCNFIHSWR